VDGRRQLFRVYRTEDRVLGSRLDSLTDDLVTLAPVRHRSRTNDGSQFLEFGTGRVTGTLHGPAGDSTMVDVQLDGGVFNSSSFDMVLRSAPLAEGWTTTVPAFLPSSRSILQLEARVVGVEIVHGERCWRVDADFDGMPVTFWITQDGRKLRQQMMRIRPDVSILFAPRRTSSR
jgi:hypothetical protein